MQALLAYFLMFISYYIFSRNGKDIWGNLLFMERDFFNIYFIFALNKSLNYLYCHYELKQEYVQI